MCELGAQARREVRKSTAMKAARVPLGRLGWRRLVIPAISMCASRHYSALTPAVASGLERARVRRDDLLVVSVSGGADSVALLRLLLALNGDDAAEWRLDLHVLHFNHALRPEAAAEEEFVRALAAQHGLPVHVRRLEPGWADDGASGGVQGRSRAWRRAESLALLSSLGAADDDGARGAIALGHHADDQAETLLLKLLRGCHLSNVQGMEWRSGGFARPLLDVRKAELVDALRADGQDWMEDASNAEPKYKRNRVRLELLPLLDELAGSGGGLRARLAAAERQSAQLPPGSRRRAPRASTRTRRGPARRRRSREPAARGAAAGAGGAPPRARRARLGRRVRAAVRAALPRP